MIQKLEMKSIGYINDGVKRETDQVVDKINEIIEVVNTILKDKVGEL